MRSVHCVDWTSQIPVTFSAQRVKQVAKAVSDGARQNQKVLHKKIALRRIERHVWTIFDQMIAFEPSGDFERHDAGWELDPMMPGVCHKL